MDRHAGVAAAYRADRRVCAGELSEGYSAGLTFRPLADTAKDTLTWYHGRPAAEQEKARNGLASDKEKTVLAEWRAKQGGG